jgi:hypothetical protein
VSRTPRRLDEALEFVRALPEGPTKEILDELRVRVLIEFSNGLKHLKDDPKDARCPQSDVDLAFVVYAAHFVLQNCNFTVRHRSSPDENW